LGELRKGIILPSGESYTLIDLLRQEPVIYTTPEWGFPKGRRDPHELDIQCAFRELEEETSIVESEVLKVLNVAPLVEQFYGSNGIHYRHSYYLAQYSGDRSISFDALNPEMSREIGNLAWKSLDEAIKVLRPENTEKKAIIQQLSTILIHFQPVIKSELYGKLLNENASEEQQRQYVYRSSGSVQEQMDRTKRFVGTRQVARRI
jgi:8-oxo-dGTP pyrophosphatase MutT (NUDIX family)